MPNTLTLVELRDILRLAGISQLSFWSADERHWRVTRFSRGFRLEELTPLADPEQHDHNDHDFWPASDLFDYLAAVAYPA